MWGNDKRYDDVVVKRSNTTSSARTKCLSDGGQRENGLKNRNTAR